MHHSKATLLSAVTVLLLCIVTTSASAQPDTVLVRRADSVRKFFVGVVATFAGEAYNLGDTTNPPDPEVDSIRNARETFGPAGSEARYGLIPPGYGFNFQNRDYWDYFYYPTPLNTVISGSDEPTLEYIMIEPRRLFHAFDNAKYIRFQLERHPNRLAAMQYPGFLQHDTTGGKALLRGSNAVDANATSHDFLIGSPVASDRDSNCLVLNTSIDQAGVIADSMWHPTFIFQSTDSVAYFRSDTLNAKTLLRFRVRIDEAIDTSQHIQLLQVITSQVRPEGSIVLRRDTIRVDHQFKHAGSGTFDTVEVRFRRINNLRQIHFSLVWPDSVDATFDYMEFMTAQAFASDQDSIDLGCCPHFGDGDISTQNAEAFLGARIDSLTSYLKRIIDSTKGHVQYMRIGDEFLFGQSYIFKRLVKLVRELSDSMIEVVPYVQDSGSGHYGKGIPNQHVFNFEGARLGWVDTSLFADPKLVFLDPYVWGTRVPLPIRTPLTDIAGWESSFATGVIPYSRNIYLDSAQVSVNHLIKVNREGKRMSLRNPDLTGKRGMQYAYLAQAGAGFENYGGGIEYASGLRPPTAPEIKVNSHIAASCGASGIMWYILGTQTKAARGNGGFMDENRNTDSMITTVAIGSDTVRRWVGFDERSDTLKLLMPIVKKYGDALFDAEYIGDWKAAELPLLHDSVKSKLPFSSSSVKALNDLMQADNFAAHLSPTVADTANKTFVHISLWRDTVGGKSDTLLYIINLRTDDSYKPGSDTVSTIDRRLVTMQMNWDHLITDVLDTARSRPLDSGIIWTPYVSAGDSLRVLLLPGDGVLVRLDTAPPQPMAQMRVAINYPKGGGDFNDHGRIKFDREVEGVRDRISDWSVPSTRYSYVGIKDADTVTMWQDSLMYDSVHSERQGRWRHQSWNELATPTQTYFGFKRKLLPSLDRNPQIAQDSIAYAVIISNAFEELTDTFKTRIFDPWFVNGTTLANYSNSGDTLLRKTPFLPHIPPPSPRLFDGSDSDGYGGVFRGQNIFRNPLLPLYSLSAYNILTRGTPVQEDSVADYTDWVFIEWATDDSSFFDDPQPWPKVIDEDATFGLVNRNRNVPVIFNKDSSFYTARYKRHLAVYDAADMEDSGFCCNNQRKLYYLGRDSLDRQHYQLVYGSAGRIYAAEGIKTGNNNADFFLYPEVLVSDWNTPYAHFPAIGYRPTEPEKFHYVYQQGDEIKIAFIHTDGSLVMKKIKEGLSSYFTTPAIASTRLPWAAVDIVAWADQGIHLRAVGALSVGGSAAPVSPIVSIGNETALYPTVWIDSCYECELDTGKVIFWLAWQQDTIIDNLFPMPDDTLTDIFASRFEIWYGSSNTGSGIHVPTIKTLSDGTSAPFDVSRLLTPSSEMNLRPCIAGMRVSDTPTVRIKLAYEAQHGPPTAAGCQGVNIVNNENGAGWTNVHFLTSCNSLDKFYKPSIEITRWQQLGGDTLVEHANWYSLMHQRLQGLKATQHWAFDSATQRIAPANFFHGLQDPQIAVTPDKVDSNLYRQAVTTDDQPRWMISGWSTLYKLGGVDSLWGYHSMSERDTSDVLTLTYGFGELGYDDESLQEFDLLDRPETESVDATHSKEYFMRSVDFTLPESNIIQWCPWVRTSDDSLFADLFDTVKFALDFYDTTGAFIFRIDSLMITDSIRRIESNLRHVTVDLVTSMRGYVVFSRRDGAFADAGVPNNIISTTRLSSTEAAKRSRKFKTLGQSGVRLTIEPNPAKNQISVIFDLPAPGPTTAMLYDQLGRAVKQVFDERVFSRGEHAIKLNTSDLQEGVYTLQFRYGNYVLSERVIILR